MSLPNKLLHEIKAVAAATLFFLAWLGALLLLKSLILAEYGVTFGGASRAVVGALILGKVVLVLEHVSLGGWVRARPAWVDVALRTVLYMVGVVIVLLIEKGFEGRHEYGGFGHSLSAVFEHVDIQHVWTNTLCIAGALLAYNALSVIRRNLGPGALVRMLLTPLPDAQEARPRG